MNVAQQFVSHAGRDLVASVGVDHALDPNRKYGAVWDRMRLIKPVTPEDRDLVGGDIQNDGPVVEQELKADGHGRRF